MVDISTLTINGTEYILKDATARSSIGELAPKASPALTGTPTAPTAAAGTNTTQIATTAFVNAAFQANDAMVFKGTIGSSGATVTALPNTHYQGWTYKVITAATYAGQACEIGDMIICVTDGTSAKDSDWTVVQSNVDGAVTGPASSTADHVATFSGTTGKVIKDSGYTIGKSVPSDAKFTDTTYSNATQSASGLMSAEDKTKLNGIATGATANTGTITGIKMNGASKGTSGVVDLGTVITSHQDISGLAPKASPVLTGTPTAPTASAGTNTTQIATTAFVMAAFQANDAMVFKGTIGSSGATVSSLPNTHYQGWTYKVTTAGTYAGQTCEIGDMIICVTDGTSAKDSDWTVVQSNVDGVVTGPASSTDAHVAIFNGTTGKVIKDSGYTIGKSVPSDAKFTDTDTKVTSSANHYSPSTASGSNIAASASGASAAWSIDVVKGVTLNTDGKGHVTGMTVTSGKIPANPNTNTTYSLTQDATDGHKITLTPSSGTAQTITIPDNNTWRPVSDSVSSTSSSDAASSKAVKTAYDLANGKVSCTTANVKSALGTGSGTTKYLREDGTWQTPPDTAPTYTYNTTTQALTISY